MYDEDFDVGKRVSEVFDYYDDFRNVAEQRYYDILDKKGLNKENISTYDILKGFINDKDLPIDILEYEDDTELLYFVEDVGSSGYDDIFEHFDDFILKIDDEVLRLESDEFSDYVDERYDEFGYW